ncbi:MAG TPA: hypothetical protein VJ798_06340 [Rhizomicrobium sp.]|nr:hypothetical protein [Rhizomicrobium sp.]
MITIKSGTSLAAAAALIALTASAVPTASFAQDAKLHCYGVNSCKGQSACKTAKNECRGQNGCKGQGFKDLTAGECAAAGGRLTEK